MREILFRGKSLNNKKWVYGSRIRYDDEHIFILPPYEQASTLTYKQIFQLNAVTVNPETVGQYIGMTGKGDTKVFEGDILNVKYSDEEGYDCECRCVIRSIMDYEILGWLNFANEIEILGNVYDTPELGGIKWI